MIQSYEWHAIFTENGKVKQEMFLAPRAFYLAEMVFRWNHPKATYWELG